MKKGCLTKLMFLRSTKRSTLRSDFLNPPVLIALLLGAAAAEIKHMRFVLISVLLLCAMARQTGAATITVTNTNDCGPGSLRQALANANNGDTISFTVTGTIALTSGGLAVTKNVTISGPGANQLAVNGNQALFAFGVFPQRTVSISGLRIRNAQVGVYNNQGTVSVSNCALSGNSSAGLYNHAGASMTVANSNISNNSGTGADNQGTLTVSSCVLSDNSNAGISNSGTVTVSNCALSGNSGGMTSFGTLTVSYCEISGNSGDGIFNGGTLTVSNCALSGNSGDGIGNRAFSSGAASLTVVNSNVSDNHSIGISNYVEEFATLTVTMRSTTVSGNSAGGVLAQGGGVIFGGGIQVTVTDCTVSGNSFWGGIHATGLTNLTVTNSTISGNSANTGFPGGDSGGGIYGANLVENSTISGNSAATSGGGIYGSIEIVNSTISGNSAGTSGGGIYNFPYSLNVANSTITGNSAPSGGGIYNKRPPVGDIVVEISNTILNAGASGENIFNDGGTITSLGYNLSSDDGGGYLTGPGDQINTDPLLGPLQNNGGPTFTHALLPGSPAIDAGDPNFSPPPFDDQRGCPRVINGRIDIGSFERQPLGRSCVTPRPRPTPSPRP